MELADIPIPSEEYPFIAFGITWLIDYVLTHSNHGHSKPNCILVDETPSMSGAEYDLIYWWHRSIQYFPNLENGARVRMLQLDKETKKFDRAELGKYLEVADSISLIENASWKFRVSRIGISERAKQAIGHFFVTVDGRWLNWGGILVMEWGDDDVIRLNTIRHTFSPGK